ncbi:site-2 protease family protein [Prosthecobacter vanneervenii]|uniref:Membrane-associated protease RseP (Regulator of RpoE activity) n=1 Tax=Prosthecobacter vanneervenii TaxID=48466 RepID=A0A7W7Y873_9BACT|nr:site-2 protease family protein [Prosthecobacter vanneervenii]MBB5031423.1 membrane-associated protease RseP (regulator of RpoE activity) [Prosthecobacter vanneervenii]
MLRFHLLGFPVQIHWIFWFNTALMGGALEANTPAELRRLLAWVAAVLVSILIHELGHALTMRNFGDRRVEIILFAFGGMAMGSRMRSRNQSLMITAGGPVLQILAGLVVGWSLTLWRPPTLWLHQFMDAFTVVSLFWALLNLVPVLPLDGGRLCQTALGPARHKETLTISLVCAVVLAGLSFERELWLGLQNGVLNLLDIHAVNRIGGGLFTLILFGMMAMNNWRQLREEPQIPWMNGR